MRRPPFVSAIVLVVLIVGVHAACGDAPRGPATPSGNSTVLPSSVTGLQLTGPDTVALGETAQFAAIATMSDGSTKDISTNGASWFSSNGGVLAITSSSGRATGRIAGEAAITARYFSRAAVKSDVVVVPAGTYRIIGSVT